MATGGYKFKQKKADAKGYMLYLNIPNLKINTFIGSLEPQKQQKETLLPPKVKQPIFKTNTQNKKPKTFYAACLLVSHVWCVQAHGVDEEVRGQASLTEPGVGMEEEVRGQASCSVRASH